MKNTTKAKSRQSSDWIVPHVIKRGTMTLIRSERHSEIAVKLAKHVADGEPLEPWDGPVSAENVLLVTKSQPAFEQAEGVRRLRVNYTISEYDKEWLRGRLQKDEPALLIADGWVMKSHELEWLEWAASRFNCAVVVTDHPGSGDADRCFERILRAYVEDSPDDDDDEGYILQFDFER